MLYSLPILWHHIVRSPRQDSPLPVLARMARARDHPLHLTIKVDADDDEIAYFLPLVSQFAHRWQQIEIDCQPGYGWYLIITMPKLSFTCMQQLKLHDIAWDTLNELLCVLAAPVLHTLDITADLDEPTEMIALEVAVTVTSRTPALTHLAIRARRIYETSRHVFALVFMYGWTFSTVTHFTTNLPINYLSALHVGNTRLGSPRLQQRFGFPAPFRMISTPLGISFPRLRYLDCSDTYPSESLQTLVRIAHVRMVIGSPLDAITFRTDLVHGVARLERYVSVCHYDQAEIECVLL